MLVWDLSCVGAGASTRQSQEYGDRGGMQSSSGSSYRDSQGGGGGGIGGRRSRGSRFEQEEPSGNSLVGLSNILRDFIPRLPVHTGPLPDIDTFVRQLRACVVPLRPSETTVSLDVSTGDGASVSAQSDIGAEIRIITFYHSLLFYSFLSFLYLSFPFPLFRIHHSRI